MGVALLFVAACAWGVLEVHFSTDTWIGLAAGRQILTEPKFPVNDTFTYTFNGKVFFNQNWLSHVYFWLLYNYIGPNAVIYGTWAAGVGMFTLVLLATRFRCGSWLAATLTAALVAIASRDWLSARPATIQFLFFSALWLCLSALISQGERRRWWAVILLLPVFGGWTHAHGSFVFGYLLLAMFLGCMAVPRAFAWFLAWQQFSPVAGLRISLTNRQVAAIIAIALVTGVLGVVLSPYGLDNYTHPFVVTESAVFREVGEWFAPYKATPLPTVEKFLTRLGLYTPGVSVPSPFPPVERFWLAFVVAVLFPLGVLMLRAFAALTGRPGGSAAQEEPRPFSTLQMAMFDLGSVAVGFYMVMFARRFAPLFYILSAPVLATWTVHLARGLSLAWRARLREIVILAAWPALVLTVYVTASRAYGEAVRDIMRDRPYSLLERITRFDASVHNTIDFLSKNKLTANVLAEWTQAGPIMFFAPTAKVFIDGRSQQVFSEQHYLLQMWIMGCPEGEEAKILEVLKSYGTDAVALRRTPTVRRLLTVLGNSPDWPIVMASQQEVLFVRRGSQLLTEMGRRERAGDLWWPDCPEAEAARGLLLIVTDPPDPERALVLWRSAVAREPMLGPQCYGWMTAALVRLGRGEEAYAYIQSEKARLQQPIPNLREDVRQLALQELQRCEAGFGQGRPTNTPGGR